MNVDCEFILDEVSNGFQIIDSLDFSSAEVDNYILATTHSNLEMASLTITGVSVVVALQWTNTIHKMECSLEVLIKVSGSRLCPVAEF